MSSMTPALKVTEGRVVTTLEDKEVMIRRAVFSPPLPLPPPSKYLVGPPPRRADTARRGLDRETVHKTLYDQAQTKALGPERINFRVLRLLWDSEPVVVLVRHYIRQDYHPRV